MALVEAMWARMREGTREDGTQIEPNDPFGDRLTQVAAQARTTPQVWLDLAAGRGSRSSNLPVGITTLQQRP